MTLGHIAMCPNVTLWFFSIIRGTGVGKIVYDIFTDAGEVGFVPDDVFVKIALPHPGTRCVSDCVYLFGCC